LRGLIADMRTLLSALPSEMETTIILSSHILAEVEQIASHCALINKGKITYSGGLDDLCSKAGAKLVIRSGVMDKTIAMLEAEGNTVSVEGEYIVATSTEASCNLAILLENLVNSGAQISHFEERKPTLEDMFLNLTAPAKEAVT